MSLACHVILKDPVIKVSCDFMGGSPLWLVATLPKLAAIGTVVVEI